MISTIWTEKYRPTTFAEIKGQKEIIEKIEKGANKEIFLLENLRFYKEEENNEDLYSVKNFVV